VLAIGGVVLLEQQASASHDAQVEVLAAVNELNALQGLPWLFDTSAAVAHGQLSAGESQLLAGLDRLRQREPNGDLFAARPLLTANFAALGRIYDYSASRKVLLSGAKTLARAQVGTLASASGQLAKTARAYSRAAYWGQVESVAGAASAIILLLVGFGVFYRRSGRTLRQLAAIVDSSEDAIGSLSLAGTILSWNAGAERMYGYTAAEVIGTSVSILMPASLHDEFPAYLERLRRGEGIDHLETTRLHKDGRQIEVAVTISPIKDATGSIVGMSAVARDITDQNRAASALRRSEVRFEEQLRQVQKMEAIGSLAGGIAHDFNNILMVIRGYSSILLENLSDEKHQHQVLQIDQAAQRAAELTHQMLAFSRQQVLNPELTDVNAIVADALVLLERVLGEDIKLDCELDPGLGSVLVDRGQLSQVILNLAGNARDAMHDGGTLSIQTANVELDEDATPEDVAPGEYILLRVADSGVGMDAETKARAFDPFFTTKAQGTGLGLAMVYGIVKQSGGHVSVSSEPGHGTTLAIYFPRVEPIAAVMATPAAPGVLDGNETILVVEDTDTVRSLVAGTIASYGYTVLQASHGAEAIEIAAEHAGSIDLLLTDVVMPELNGRELAERLVAEYPGLKVLFTSGYPADAVLRRGIATAQAAFIEKPYPIEQLALKIREVLGAPALAAVRYNDET
jgi:PAS domain S-box-containing protein